MSNSPKGESFSGECLYINGFTQGIGGYKVYLKLKGKETSMEKALETYRKIRRNDEQDELDRTITLGTAEPAKDLPVSRKSSTDNGE